MKDLLILIFTTIIRVLAFTALAVSFGMLLAKNANAEHLDLKDEPAISVYQATETGYSVIVLQWLDGKTERLVIKNGDKTGYIEWFKDRLNAHEQGVK